MNLTLAPRPEPIKDIPTTFFTINQLQEQGLSYRHCIALLSEFHNTSYHLFMDTFCDPKDFVIPVKLDKATGQIGIDDSARLSDLDNSKIVVDPKRVSKQLLKNLGIISAQEKKITITEDVVGKLKEVFIAMSPVPDTNQRMQVVTQDSPLIFNLEEQRPGVLGSVLYFRRRINSDSKVVMYFSNLADAYRKTIHEERHHLEEVGKLTKLANNVIELRSQVGEWKGLEPEERTCLASFAKEVSGDVGEQLRNVLLLSKILARDKVCQSEDITDAKGRKNPSAIWAKLHSAVGNFRKRVHAITKISQANLEDRLALIQYKTTHLQVFEKAAEKLENNLNSPSFMLAFKDGPRALGNEETKQQIGNFMVHLGLSPRILSQVEARPYLTFRKKIEDLSLELEKSALVKDPTLGSKVLRQMFLCTKLIALQEDLLNLKESASKGVDSFLAVCEKLEKLKSSTEKFYQANQSDCFFVTELEKQIGLQEAVILGARELQSDLTEKTLARFRAKFLAELSFENVLKSDL